MHDDLPQSKVFYLSKTETCKFYLLTSVCWYKSKLPVCRCSQMSYFERALCFTTTRLIIQNSHTTFSTSLTFLNDLLFRSFTKFKITWKQITLTIHFIFFARHVRSQRESDGTESHWKFCVRIRVLARWRRVETSTRHDFSKFGMRSTNVRPNNGSIRHNNLFTQYQLNNMFRPNGPLSGWQEWKKNILFWMEIELSTSYILLYYI